MADSRDTQGPALVGLGEPLKQIANLYGTTASASTPYTKDSDQKQIPPRYMAEITQAVLERLKETIPAQTPTSAPNTVLETPGSATISPESTDQIPKPLFLGNSSSQRNLKCNYAQLEPSFADGLKQKLNPASLALYLAR